MIVRPVFDDVRRKSEWTMVCYVDTIDTLKEGDLEYWVRRVLDTYPSVYPETERLRNILVSKYDEKGARNARKLLKLLEKYGVDTADKEVQSLVAEWQSKFKGFSGFAHVGRSKEFFSLLGETPADKQSCFSTVGCNRLHPFILYVNPSSFVIFITKNREFEVEQVIARCWGIKGNRGVYITNFYWAKGVPNATSPFVEAVKKTFFDGKDVCVARCSLNLPVYLNGNAMVVSSTENPYTPTKTIRFSSSSCYVCGSNNTYDGQWLCRTCCESYYDAREGYACEECGTALHPDDVLWIGDFPACSYCATGCCVCGRGVWVNEAYYVGDNPYCQRCYEDNCAYCEICENDFDTQYIRVEFINSTPVCQYCIEEHRCCIECASREVFRIVNGNAYCEDCVPPICCECGEESDELEEVGGNFYCKDCLQEFRFQGGFCYKCECPTFGYIECFEGNKVKCMYCR